jgi:hypothetical protein
MKGIVEKAPEAKLIAKVRSFIDYMYPDIEEKTREIFVHENEEGFKVIKRKVDFRLGFHAWFLLKYIFPSGATAIEMADSFPMDFFTKKEKEMIKNFLNYKESLFEIIKISDNKKDYTIKDLLDNKKYLVKTLDLPAKFQEKSLINAIIIKNIKEDYFFYGAVKSFNINNKKEFIKEFLREIRDENKERKMRESVELEWEFLK